MSVSSAPPGLATVSASAANPSSGSVTAHTSSTRSDVVAWSMRQSAAVAAPVTLLCDMSSAMRDGAFSTAGRMSSAQAAEGSFRAERPRRVSWWPSSRREAMAGAASLAQPAGPGGGAASGAMA